MKYIQISNYYKNCNQLRFVNVSNISSAVDFNLQVNRKEEKLHDKDAGNLAITFEQQTDIPENTF